MRSDFGWKRKVHRGIAIGLLAVLCVPFPTQVSPAWNIRVIDDKGNVIVNSHVSQDWQHYSVENIGHYEMHVTDSYGNVLFPERRVWANLLHRICGPIWNTITYGVHAGYGPSLFIIVRHDGYEEETILADSKGVIAVDGVLVCTVTLVATTRDSHPLLPR